MKIVKISTFQTFLARYLDSEQPLKAWIDEAKNAQ